MYDHFTNSDLSGPGPDQQLQEHIFRGVYQLGVLLGDVLDLFQMDSLLGQKNEKNRADVLNRPVRTLDLHFHCHNNADSMDALQGRMVGAFYFRQGLLGRCRIRVNFYSDCH